MTEKGKKPDNRKKSHSGSQELFDKIFRTRLAGEKVKPLNEQKTPEKKGPLSDSLEMFDTLFRQELVREKAGSEKKKADIVKKKASLEKGQAAKKTSEKKLLKAQDRVSRSAPKEDLPSGQRNSKKKMGKSSARFKLILLLLFVVVFAAAALHYSGVLDLSKLAGRQIAPPRKALRPQKGAPVARSKIPPKPKAATHIVNRPLPPKHPAPVKPGAVQEKPPQVEGASKIPSKALAAVSPGKGRGSEAKPMADKEKSRIAPIETTVKVGKEKAPLFPEKRVSYPYSIYLGSYRSKKYLREAIVAYRKMGLSPYEVKVDLGPKGIWCRVFSGHFRSREEASAFLNEKKIPGAEIRHTRYAVMVGIYPSLRQAEKMKSKLAGIGYDPYIIPGRGQEVGLYVGAFYRKERAEKLNLELASREIDGRIVKR